MFTFNQIKTFISYFHKLKLSFLISRGLWNWIIHESTLTSQSLFVKYKNTDLGVAAVSPVKPFTSPLQSCLCWWASLAPKIITVVSLEVWASLPSCGWRDFCLQNIQLCVTFEQQPELVDSLSPLCTVDEEGNTENWNAEMLCFIYYSVVCLLLVVFKPRLSHIIIWCTVIYESKLS